MSNLTSENDLDIGYCRHCSGEKPRPISRPVVNSPADEAEVRDRAHTAPPQSDPADRGRDKTGASSGSEARPVTATERLSSLERLRGWPEVAWALDEMQELRQRIVSAEDTLELFADANTKSRIDALKMMKAYITAYPEPMRRVAGSKTP